METMTEPQPVTRDQIIDLLTQTARARYDDAAQFADALIEYQTASDNINRNGLIVAHPRTGNPLQNPYLPIRDRAFKKLQSMRYLWSDAAWRLVEGKPAPEPPQPTETPAKGRRR